MDTESTITADTESTITADTESTVTTDTTTTDTYGPETLISVHTGRPIDETPNLIDTTTKFHRSNFWCEICHVKLRNAITALCHLRGRAHKRKLNASSGGGDESGNNTLKRKLDRSSDAADHENGGVEGANGVEGAQSKKSKKQTSETESIDGELLKCEMCTREFQTPVAALQHFKGKKHTTKIELRLVADMKCDDCSLQFATALLAVKHFKGKKHVAKILSVFREKTGGGGGGGGGGEVKAKTEPKQTDVSATELKCELCDCAFTCSANAVQHFTGKRHASKVVASSNVGNAVKEEKSGAQENGGEESNDLHFAEDENGGGGGAEGENNWTTTRYF